LWTAHKIRSEGKRRKEGKRKKEESRERGGTKKVIILKPEKQGSRGQSNERLLSVSKTPFPPLVVTYKR
jgi:hypothetical protein